MEAAISSIGVAALSGLTLLAYRHPSVYKKLFIIISIIFAFTVPSTALWNLAVTETGIALDSYISGGKKVEALEAKRSVEAPLWLYLAYFGLYGYAVFLLALPKMIEASSDAEK